MQPIYQGMYLSFLRAIILYLTVCGLSDVEKP